MSEFRSGDRVRVVNATDPDACGITGTVARRSRPGEVIVRVEVAGFHGEECSFRTAELGPLAPPNDDTDAPHDPGDCGPCEDNAVDLAQDRGAP